MNNFYEGCRVRYIGKTTGTMINGECGTVLGYADDDVFFDLVRVRWDERRSGRHSCNGHCEQGHGWNVFEDNLAYEDPIDLGEIEAPDSIESLFGV